MADSRIEAAIMGEYPDATKIRYHVVVSHFLDGNVYYAEFKEDGKEDFCYLFVTDSEVRLYDDGESVIKGLQVILDRRRSPLQRMGEFTLTEFIGAIIAISVTVAFIYLSISNGPSKEFLGIFSLIAGYYFGKNVTK